MGKMRFGNCPECSEYKYLKDKTGICQTCEDEGKADINDLLERAMNYEEFINKINS